MDRSCPAATSTRRTLPRLSDRAQPGAHAFLPLAEPPRQVRGLAAGLKRESAIDACWLDEAVETGGHQREAGCYHKSTSKGAHLSADPL